MEQKGIFLTECPENIYRVYGNELAEILPVRCKIYGKKDILDAPGEFKDIKYIFSTWGMPRFTESEIKELLPSLEAVFYAAGSVKHFAEEFLLCGVKVFSAWQANAVPVAEYTVAQIILANKGYFSSSRIKSAENYQDCAEVFNNYPGNYGVSVGLIGLGTIGKMVLKRLGQFNISVLAFDAFMSDTEISSLGAKKASLEDIFSSCAVISNHLANNEETKGMLGYSLFSRMPRYSTFINTGRGAQVIEDDLVKILTEREDITALLDVTCPEPPITGHPFYQLPNCILTPHIAGSSGNEVKRMGEYMKNAYADHIKGNKSSGEVTLSMLKTMA